MVCKLPSRIKAAIARYEECRRTEDVVSGLRKGRDCDVALDEEMRQARSYRLGSGVSRIGYRFDEDCVVKVDKGELMSANKTEIDTYKRLPSKARKFFVPITDYAPNGRWLVQPRVDILEDEGLGEDEEQDVIDEVYANLSSVGYRCTDLHNENVGFSEGDPVILDYGFGVEGRLRNPRCRAVKVKVPLSQRTLTKFVRRRR